MDSKEQKLLVCRGSCSCELLGGVVQTYVHNFCTSHNVWLTEHVYMAWWWMPSSFCCFFYALSAIEHMKQIHIERVHKKHASFGQLSNVVGEIRKPIKVVDFASFFHRRMTIAWDSYAGSSSRKARWNAHNIRRDLTTNVRSIERRFTTIIMMGTRTYIG